MSVPILQILSAIGEVSAEVGHDLLPLFQNRIPALKTTPLPDASENMRDARRQRLAELESEAEAVPDTEPPPR